MTSLRTIGAQAPATPGADEARHATGRKFSRPIYHDHHDLQDRIWSWLRRPLDVGGVAPGAPSWVSTLIVVPVVAAGIALLTLLLTRLSSAYRVATPPSLPVFTDGHDADALTRAANAAATQTDFTAAVVERFRVIIRFLDEREIIDEYLGIMALEVATLTHQTLGEHRATALLYEVARLLDAVLYGRMVSTSAQDQQIRELTGQMTTVRFPSGRVLVDASAHVPGTPA